MEKELTQKQIDRQDFVDYKIQVLISDLEGVAVNDSNWNIEDIGTVRDALQRIIVDKHNRMTEQEFYPFIEE